MIRIICGTCGTSKGYKTMADGNLTLPAAEERRLVARGVADYVTRPIIGPDTGVATAREDENSGSVGVTPPGDIATSTGQETSAGEDTVALLEDEVKTDGIVEIVNNHFTVESLMELTRADMEELAAGMGVDVSKCRNKGEIASLLSAAEVETGGDNTSPPELSAEGAVV
ncbi:hypothetical protein D1159_16170 [Pseudoflavonifractor sp. 524-17]|uniref:hypothetical protein n=1 Tax=Pseudoflavonifractor sp. 524-17 TaxID=2304577 RepID=UPI00137A768E|nr:hypothetical protein [Pseudoflavonifractor sp. 524-17]NCE66073.1 hypothetical protein [Pseudoflavonifractor sp. 524-17]